MAIQFFDSPFHVTHGKEVASKIALKMELSVFITDCIKPLVLTRVRPQPG
ncbi:hypothetical protein J2W17_003330 [Pseudomonas lini]|nr:hypothetical protein [Pseudomonas lini]